MVMNVLRVTNSRHSASQGVAGLYRWSTTCVLQPSIKHTETRAQMKAQRQRIPSLAHNYAYKLAVHTHRQTRIDKHGNTLQEDFQEDD